MAVADSYDDWLRHTLESIGGQVVLPFSELPRIEMTPEETQTVAAVLAVCDEHGRQVFRSLLEGWQRAGRVVEPGTGSIGLKIVLGDRHYSLAALRPGVGERRQLVILGWESLRRDGIFPAPAVDRFQAAVSELAPLRVTESTAHLEVTEDFTLDKARELLRALRTLAKAAEGET
jgi:hypothetical protein